MLLAPRHARLPSALVKAREEWRMLMQRVGNPKRWECGERGAKRHLEKRQGFLSLAFFEIAQHPGERLSMDEFLAPWIESHGDARLRFTGCRLYRARRQSARGLDQLVQLQPDE